MYLTKPTRLLEDRAANDSNKSWTVPDFRAWLVRGVYIDFTATATAGNRFVAFDILNGSLIVYRSRIANAITASQQEFVIGGTSVDTEPVEGVATFHYLPLPDITISPGLVVRFWDLTAVDAAADDMLVSLWVDEYSFGAS